MEQESMGETVSCTIGGLKIQMLPNVVNFGVHSFASLALRIDELDRSGREWLKVNALCSSQAYVSFVSTVTGVGRQVTRNALRDFSDDVEFRQQMSWRLEALDEIESAGDLRFHAITLYAFTRLLKPRVVVETGVAHGKSSAFIPLALHHNGFGDLFSFDLPPGGTLLDGSATTLSDRHTGWLIPDYLRDRWKFSESDSLTGPKTFVQELPPHQMVDIFIHDSLHTYEHVRGELSVLNPRLSPDGLVACDNINMAGGRAWSDWLVNRGISGWAYRDFGAACLEPGALV